MASLDGKESAKDATNSSDNVKIQLGEENSGINNLYETNCGSCEGCKLAVDCGTCENCVLNYIEVNIKFSKNLDILPCLKRMCNSLKIKLETGKVVPLFKKTDQLKMNSILTQTTASDEIGEKPKNCIKLEAEQGPVLQEDTVSKMKRKKTEGSNMETDEEVVRKVILMEYGSSSLEDIIENSDDEDGNDDFSNTESTEMCGSCVGCTTNCGSCWECMEREMVASKETESRLICQNKKCNRMATHSMVRLVKKGGDEVNIKTVRCRRKRCGTCPGCTLLENCQACYPCLNAKASKNVCKKRKCHNLKKTSQGCVDDQVFGPENKVETRIKKGDKDSVKIFGPENKIETNVKNGEKNLKRTKRCGECDGCYAQECGYCQGCQISQHFAKELLIGKLPCLKKNCKNPIELSGDMDMIPLIAQQDDSSSGSVCPVKISNRILYDFRCFFCKKLPRVGSANRSELMRHYSNYHYADELRSEFANLENGEHCFLCDVKLNSGKVPSHFGQKHNHVLKYLPPEAAAFIEGIQLKTGAQCYPTEVLASHYYPTEIYAFQELNSPQISESLKVPSDVDQFSSNKGWKAISLGESGSEGMSNQSKAMNEWIEENDSNKDQEVVPLSDKCNSSLDLSGFSGRCSICSEEFSQVPKTAEHLHKDHGIMGSFTDILEDCQNLIQGGYIRLFQKQLETSISSSDYKSCLAFETYLMAESQRNATQNSRRQTNQDDFDINKKNSKSESSQRNTFKSPWIFKK